MYRIAERLVDVILDAGCSAIILRMDMDFLVLLQDLGQGYRRFPLEQRRVRQLSSLSFRGVAAWTRYCYHHWPRGAGPRRGDRLAARPRGARPRSERAARACSWRSARCRHWRDATRRSELPPALEADARNFDERMTTCARPRKRCRRNSARSATNCSRGQKEFLKRPTSVSTSGDKLRPEIVGCSSRSQTALKRYEEGVAKVEEERRDAFGICGPDRADADGQEQVATEAAKLVNALRNAPKARGRWGEQQLRNVLESCGPDRTLPISRPRSARSRRGRRRLRPDVDRPGARRAEPGDRRQGVAQRLSGRVRRGRRGRAAGGSTPTSRRSATMSTARHQGLLGQFEDAPDYVVMFIPGEHFLTAALEQDDPMGLGVRQAGAARHPDQSRRHRPDRRGGLAAGEAGQGSAADRRARQGVVRPAGQGRRRSAQGRHAGSTSAVSNYNSLRASCSTAAGLVTGAQVPRPRHRAGSARDRSVAAGRGAGALRRRLVLPLPTATGDPRASTIRRPPGSIAARTSSIDPGAVGQRQLVAAAPAASHRLRQDRAALVFEAHVGQAIRVAITAPAFSMLPVWVYPAPSELQPNLAPIRSA